MNKRRKSALPAIYQKLFAIYGPQNWWPAKTKFEVAVGAILTQNTTWGNVVRALGNLKSANCLSAKALHTIPQAKLSSLIRPAGYFNVKARRLKNFVNFFMDEFFGSFRTMGRVPLAQLRQMLLSVNGIGKETADSILLYALDKPVFVVDAYTKRLLYRHNLVGKNADYDEVQKVFLNAMETDTGLFNEYHALIVRIGKEF